jgi:hypothetical protein
MPKKIDQKVKERCVRQVLEQRAEYSSLTAASTSADGVRHAWPGIGRCPGGYWIGVMEACYYKAGGPRACW